MQHYKKPWKGWGALASMALHLSVVFLLLFRLSEALPKAPEEAIKVEVVPPAPPKPPAKTQSKPVQSKPQPAPPPSPPPQGFESAMAKTDEKVTEPQLPPEEQDAPKSADTTPEDAAPAKTETQPAAEKPDSSTKPDLPKLDLPVTDRGDVPRKDEAPTAQQVADAKAAAAQTEKAPEQKPAQPKSGKQKPLKLVRAKKLFSPNALSDPRVRQAIGNLPRNQRILQLCGNEAMQQVRNQRPDADLLAYSPSGRTIASGALNSREGAYRNRSNWYNLDFKCQVDAAAMEVVSFSFAFGNAVPRNDWPERKLPAD